MPEKTKRILGIHAGLVFAELVCVSAFALEIGRALSGNTLSWAYVFEWPVFAAYAIYVWHRLLKEERAPIEPDDATPNETNEPDDPALNAYNSYLNKMHAAPSDDTQPPS